MNTLKVIFAGDKATGTADQVQEWTQEQIDACDNSGRQRIIQSAKQRTPDEEIALRAALFERAKSDKYECALRHALCSLERGHVGTAAAEIRIALLSIQ